MNGDPTAAVIAHGLFNAVAAVGATAELLSQGERESASPLCGILERQLRFLAASVEELADHAGPELEEAVTATVRSGTRVVAACHARDWDEVEAVTAELADCGQMVGDSLRYIVQGLPPEAIIALDSLNAQR